MRWSTKVCCSNPAGQVIFVPYIQKGGLKTDRIMVCWDGRPGRQPRRLPTQCRS
jgi:hypothetical protein